MGVLFDGADLRWVAAAAAAQEVLGAAVVVVWVEAAAALMQPQVWGDPGLAPWHCCSHGDWELQLRLAGACFGPSLNVLPLMAFLVSGTPSSSMP